MSSGSGLMAAWGPRAVTGTFEMCTLVGCLGLCQPGDCALPPLGHLAFPLRSGQSH